MSPIVSKQGPLKCATPYGMYLGLESECVGQVEKIPSSSWCYPPSLISWKPFPVLLWLHGKWGQNFLKLFNDKSDGSDFNAVELIVIIKSKSFIVKTWRISCWAPNLIGLFAKKPFWSNFAMVPITFWQLKR